MEILNFVNKRYIVPVSFVFEEKLSNSFTLEQRLFL